jgi:hypothetical protein
MGAVLQRLLATAESHKGQIQQLKSENDALHSEVLALQRSLAESRSRNDSCAPASAKLTSGDTNGIEEPKMGEMMPVTSGNHVGSHRISARGLSPYSKCGQKPRGTDTSAITNYAQLPTSLNKATAIESIPEGACLSPPGGAIRPGDAIESPTIWEPPASSAHIVSQLKYHCDTKSFVKQTKELHAGIQQARDLWELCRPLIDGTMSPSMRNERIVTIGHWIRTSGPPNEWVWKGPDTPLVTAVAASQLELTKLFLRAKVDPNDKWQLGKLTCLQLASFNGNISIGRALLQHNADVNQRDKLGQTAIFFAPRSGMCKLLVDAKADLRVLSNEGQSALHVAAINGFTEVLAWLRARVSQTFFDHHDNSGMTAEMRLKQRTHPGKKALQASALNMRPSAAPLTATGEAVADSATEEIAGSPVSLVQGRIQERVQPSLSLPNSVRRATSSSDIQERIQPSLSLPNSLRRVTSNSDTTNRQLKISFLRATGLRHLNMSGDAPWCECQVGTNGPKCQTGVVKGTLDPEWNETHEITWRPDMPLIFTVFDQGLIGSKTEGKATMQCERFLPGGFEGDLEIGNNSGKLTVKIEVLDVLIEVAMIKANLLGEAPRDAPQCSVSFWGGPSGSECKTSNVSGGGNGGTLNPEWNEVHDLLWRVSEPLTFRVSYQGASSSKTEFSATLPSREFYPNGFEGSLDILSSAGGQSSGQLQVRVVVSGMTSNITGMTSIARMSSSTSHERRSLSKSNRSFMDYADSPDSPRSVMDPRSNGSYSHAIFDAKEDTASNGSSRKAAIEDIGIASMRKVTNDSNQRMTVMTECSIATNDSFY